MKLMSQGWQALILPVFLVLLIDVPVLLDSMLLCFVLPPTAVPTIPVCVSGRRAFPPKEVGDLSGYDQCSLDQFGWRYVALDRLLTGEDIREDDAPTWFWSYQAYHFDKDYINRKLTKLDQRVILIFSFRKAATTSFCGFEILKSISAKLEEQINLLSIRYQCTHSELHACRCS